MQAGSCAWTNPDRVKKVAIHTQYLKGGVHTRASFVNLQLPALMLLIDVTVHLQ